MDIRINRWIAAALGGVVLGWAASAAQAAEPAAMRQGILADSHGMTLYTFDKDAGGKSACNGKCADNWPPLTAPADASAHGDYTVITRDDGSKQWAYKGHPLYRWHGDKQAGDKNGDGKIGMWHIVR